MVHPEQSRSMKSPEKGVKFHKPNHQIFVMSIFRKFKITENFMIRKFLVRIISKNLPETNSHVLKRLNFLQNP